MLSKLMSVGKNFLRIVSMKDIWFYSSHLQRVRLVGVVALNLIDTFAKLAGPYALSKFIEVIATSKDKEVIYGVEFSAEELIFTSVAINLLHQMMPYVRKAMLYGIQDGCSKKISREVFLREQELSIDASNVSLNKLLQETCKYLQAANYETINLLSTTTETIHPLIFDTILGVTFTFIHFERAVGAGVLTCTITALIANELLVYFTKLPENNQQTILNYNEFINFTYETLMNAETVHLLNRQELEALNINSVYSKFSISRKRYYRYELLWVIQPILAAAIQILATGYVSLNSFQKLELDDVVFLLNYVVNIGASVSSINYSLLSALSAVKGLNDVSIFLKRSENLNNKRSVGVRLIDIDQTTPLLKNNISINSEISIYRKEKLYSTDIAIEFKNVSFYYDAENPILNSISFKLPVGAKIGLVGVTTAGKSTIIKLLCRLIEPTNENAKIKIFGRDIRSIPLDELRNLISVVRQQIDVFRDSSIIYNILYGFGSGNHLHRLKTMKSKQTDEIASNSLEVKKVSEVAEAVKLEGCLAREDSRGLSGGQHQRIGIARVLARNSSIFIFDEPTSQLDSETEQKVLATIKEATEGKTSLMIAHRLSTIKGASKIFVLGKSSEDEKGSKIIEQGTHEELISADGSYANLWRLQTS